MRSFNNTTTAPLTLRREKLTIDLKSAISEILSNYRNEFNSYERNPRFDKSKEELSIDNKLVVRDKGECHFIDKKDIIYAEAMGAYTDIILKDARKIMISKNLKTLTLKLNDERFLRTHKSYLVNAKFISKYVKTDGGYLVLENGVNIPISVRKREIISELIGKLAV